MARKKRIEHHPIIKQFAAQLRAVRRERSMSQYTLALRAQVALSYIGKLERSEAAPGLDMVGRLAEALGVPPERLITGSERQQSPLPVIREQIERHTRKIAARKDQQSLQAVSIVLGLIDNALART